MQNSTKSSANFYRLHSNFSLYYVDAFQRKISRNSGRIFKKVFPHGVGISF